MDEHRTSPRREQSGERPPIFQYWHAEEIPAEIAATVATFRELNPDLRHLVFSRADAERFIEERFGPREAGAFRACAVPAMQADYFRYCAVLALGGIYVDVGFRCRQGLRSLLDASRGGRLFTLRADSVVTNGFFLFGVARHPLLSLTLEIATANIEGRVAQEVNMVTGPAIFTGLCALYRLGSFEAMRESLAHPRFQRLLAFSIETIGDFSRVTEAFDGVRIATFEEARGWIASPDTQLQYKRSETRWVDWPRQVGSIFQ